MPRFLHICTLTGHLALVATLALLTPLLQAGTPNIDKSEGINLQQRYPDGSIQSSKVADLALKEVKYQRDLIKKRYKQEGRTCYREHFFANHCRSQARKRYRAALHETDRVRLDAKRFKRRAALAQHNNAIIEKQKESPSLIHIQGHANPDANQAPKRTTLSAQERIKNEATYARKLQRHEARKRKLAEKKARKAAK